MAPPQLRVPPRFRDRFWWLFPAIGGIVDRHPLFAFFTGWKFFLYIAPLLQSRFGMAK